LLTVPNLNYKTEKSSLIVFPVRAESAPVPRWRKQGSVTVFPSHRTQGRRNNVFGRILQTLFPWLKAQKNGGPEKLPARKVGDRRSQGGTRSAGH
jgi:hypothetical protein